MMAISFFIFSYAWPVDAVLSAGCISAAEQYQLNLTQLLMLSRRVLLSKKDLDYHERARFGPLLDAVFRHREDLLLPEDCPCAVLVASSVLIGLEATHIASGDHNTNMEHTKAFHRMALLQKAIKKSSETCSMSEARVWPAVQALDALWICILLHSQ